MPFLERHVARALRREPERRPLHLLAGEDAVAAREHRVELALGNVLHLARDHRDIAHRVEREAADVVAQVAPPVQVPVVAVVDEALRGDFALGHLVARAVPVRELEAAPAEDGGGDELEMLRLVAPRPERDHADAPAHFLGRMVAHGEQRRQSRLQRLHVRAEDARLEALEEMLHGEERLRLARAEPQPRQLVLGRRRIRRLEPIAALLAVPRDGRVVAAPHVLDVALEGGE